MQLKHPGHSALPARAILAAFQPSAAILRPMAAMAVSRPSPPGRMMAVIQPSQPSAGRWLSLLDPDHKRLRGWLRDNDASHPEQGVVARGARVEPPGLVSGRREGWVEFATAILRPNGCDGCMTAILRPGGWLGHSHRSHRPEDGCTGWMAAKMACAGRAEWLGSCNCSHAC